MQKLTDLSSLGVWSEHVDNLNSSLQNVLFDAHVHELRCLLVDGCRTIYQTMYDDILPD